VGGTVHGGGWAGERGVRREDRWALLMNCGSAGDVQTGVCVCGVERGRVVGGGRQAIARSSGGGGWLNNSAVA